MREELLDFSPQQGAQPGLLSPVSAPQQLPRAPAQAQVQAGALGLQRPPPEEPLVPR